MTLEQVSTLVNQIYYFDLIIEEPYTESVIPEPVIPVVIDQPVVEEPIARDPVITMVPTVVTEDITDPFLDPEP